MNSELTEHELAHPDIPYHFEVILPKPLREDKASGGWSVSDSRTEFTRKGQWSNKEAEMVLANALF